MDKPTESEHCEPGLDIETPEELSPELAKLAAEITQLMSEPAYKLFFDLDNREAENVRPKVTSAYIQDLAIGYALVDLQAGREPLGNIQAYYDHLAEIGIITLPIQGVNAMHGLLSGMATYSGKNIEEFTATPDEWDTTKLAAALINDYSAYCDLGLIDKEGDSDNFQYATARLRALNMVLLFSNIVEQENMPPMYAETMNKPLEDKDKDQMLVSKAKELAAMYAGQNFNPNKLAKFRRNNIPKLNEIINLAARILIIDSAAGQFDRDNDIEKSRQAYREALRAVGQSELVEISSRAVKLLEIMRTSGNKGVEASQIIEKSMALQWEVLPPGEVQAIAKEIVSANQTETKQPEIDLERLLILDQIRKEWGEDNAYYARGVLGKRKVVKANGSEEPDQYLILVLQERDAEGDVIAEHAVAESPITQRNALYVFRQDVSEGLSWREVMALPKSYAKALGARPVKHILPRSSPEGFLVASMAEKVSTLLSATKEEFPQIEFNGERGVRLRAPASILPPVETA